LKKLDEEKIIHLLKGKGRYITIMPYKEFKKMKNLAFKHKPARKKDEYDIRFKENLLSSLLSYFGGDLVELANFIDEANLLTINPIPDNAVKVEADIYKVLIKDFLIFYHLSEKSKLITVLSIERTE
jgi:hypothetical protein